MISAVDQTLDWFHYSVYQVDKNLLHNTDFIKTTKLISTKDKVSKFHFTLKIMRWNNSEQTECNHRKGTFIKNPTFSYLLFDEEFESAKIHLQWDQFRCKLKFQPYFYMLTQNETDYILYEVQLFSKRSVLLATTRLDNLTHIQLFNTDVYERRSNFNKQIILSKKLVKGEDFMMDVFTLFQQKFNFLPKHNGTGGSGGYQSSIDRLITHDLDIAIGEFTFTPVRLQVVDPGNPLLMVKRELMYRISNPKGNWKSLTSVLSTDLWLAIFASMLIFYFIFMITSRLKSHGLEFLSIILQAYLAQNFTEESFWKAYGCKKKALVLSLQLLSFLGAIIFWTYSGCLVSFFTFSHSGPPIRSLGDLIKRQVELKHYNGSTYLSVQKWLFENYGDVGKVAVEESVDPFAVEGHDSMADIVRAMAYDTPRNDLGILCESQSHTRHLKNLNLDPCLFGRQKIPELADKPVGWMYPKNSILRILFNRYTLQLQENGVFQQMENQHFPPKSNCPATPFHRIDLGTVTIVFVIFVIGFLISLLTFLTEKFRPPPKNLKKYSSKRKTFRSNSF